MPPATEWDDPYPIVEPNDPSPDEERRRELVDALDDEYRETHTTTPLDADARFELRELSAVDDRRERYRFQATRFVHGAPGRTYAGIAERRDGGWTLTLDDPKATPMSLLVALSDTCGRLGSALSRLAP